MKRLFLVVGLPLGILIAVVGVGALVAALVFLALFMVREVWAWVVPDLFPGAVRQGLIARDISWYSAFKVVMAVVLLGGIANANGHKSKSRD